MRTPLTYYGGKQFLSAQIVPFFPSHRIYLEPFAGGAATLFAKPRAGEEIERECMRAALEAASSSTEKPEEEQR